MSNKTLIALTSVKVDTGERDEWVYLAELNLNTTSNNNHPGLPKKYRQIGRSNYTPQEIGDMPHWINT